MVMVTRPSPRFSMTFVEPVEPIRMARSPMSRARRLERRIVLAWKMLTQAASRSSRSSNVPKDFVLVTSRRRSILPPAHSQGRHRHAFSA